MNKEELLKLLKENLTVEADTDTCLVCDYVVEKRIVITIKFDGTEICSTNCSIENT